jgi:hypothetical protein
MLLRQKTKIGNFVFGNSAKPVEKFLFWSGGRQFFVVVLGKSEKISLFRLFFFVV